MQFSTFLRDAMWRTFLICRDKYATAENEKGREMYNIIRKYYVSTMPLFFSKHDTNCKEGSRIGHVTIVTSTI